ncbi:hypothetical protein WA158_007141 [Blastocystis sp. Blastoise]
MATRSCVTLNESYSRNTVQFVFQDEIHVGIPISILQLYPNSILNLTYDSPDSLDNNDHACYIDYPSYSIEKLILFFEGKLSINSSLPVLELCNMYKAINIFFNNEAYPFRSELYNAIQAVLLHFLKENNCAISEYSQSSDITEHILTIKDIISEERNKKFLEYSCIFDVTNVTCVQLKYIHSNEISYDSIYPPNIHELFPQILKYDIERSEYFKSNSLFQLERVDNESTFDTRSHPINQYDPINQNKSNESIQNNKNKVTKAFQSDIQLVESSRTNNEINKKNLYNDENIHLHSSYSSLSSHSLDNHFSSSFLSSSISPSLSSSISSSSSVITSPSIHEDKKNQINSSPKTTFSNHLLFRKLFFKSKSKNSDLSIHDMSQNDPITKSRHYNFCFHFIDDHDGIIPVSLSDSIFTYILNMPICESLKEIYVSDNNIYWKLQKETPPLLIALENGLFDLHTTLNITDFICDTSDDRYKKLVEDYLSKHIFPNVTTLRINNQGNRLFGDNMLNRFLYLFTTERFPQLHIYDLQYYSITHTQPITNLDILFQIPLIKQLHTIYINISFLQESVLVHFDKKSFFYKLLPKIKCCEDFIYFKNDILSTLLFQKQYFYNNIIFNLADNYDKPIYSEDLEFMNEEVFKTLYIYDNRLNDNINLEYKSSSNIYMKKLFNSRNIHDKLEIIINSGMFKLDKVPNNMNIIMRSFKLDSLEEIHFKCIQFSPYKSISVNDLISIFKNANYPNLKKLSIQYDSSFANISENEKQINTKNMPLLLSLFSNNLQELNLLYIDYVNYLQFIISNFPSLQLDYQQPIKILNMSRRFDHFVEFNKKYWNSIYNLLTLQNIDLLESLYINVYEESNLIQIEELFKEKKFPSLKECAIYVIGMYIFILMFYISINYRITVYVTTMSSLKETS